MHAVPKLVPAYRRLAVGAVCVIASVTLAAPPAHAADGTLSGVVTAEDTGAPLAGVWITVYAPGDTAEDDLKQVASGSTDAQGRYSFDTIPAGKKYRVSFYADGYLQESAHDRDNPYMGTDIAVPATLDEKLTPEAHISGLIVDENGQPVTDGYVYAERDDDSTMGHSGYGQISEDGRYTITTVAPGSYTVWVSVPGRLTQYFHGSFLPDKRTVVVLKAGDNTADEKLLPKPTGVVRGVVTDKITGKPVQGICVNFQGSATMPDQGMPESCTGADGTYTFTGIATQEATLSIYDNQSRYVTDGVVPVVAQDGRTVSQDFALARATRVTATVVDGATGKAVPANTMCLEVWRADGKPGGGGDCADEPGGAVAVEVEKPGKYILIAKPRYTDSDRYGFGWVSADGTVTFDPSKAKVFSAVSGKTTAAGKVKAVKGGSITGRITNKATGKPVKRACIGAGTYHPRAGEFPYPSACTDDQGRYTIHGFAPGGWALNIVSGEVPAWLYSGGAGTPDKATPVQVTAGKSKRYDLAVFPGASTLAGSLTIPGDYYDLDVLNADTQAFVQFGTDGPLVAGKAKYQVRGIAPQRVKIRYEAGDGTMHWYGGKDFASAKVVTLKPGVNTVNITAK